MRCTVRLVLGSILLGLHVVAPVVAFVLGHGAALISKQSADIIANANTVVARRAVSAERSSSALHMSSSLEKSTVSPEYEVWAHCVNCFFWFRVLCSRHSAKMQCLKIWRCSPFVPTPSWEFVEGSYYYCTTHYRYSQTVSSVHTLVVRVTTVCCRYTLQQTVVVVQCDSAIQRSHVGSGADEHKE